MQRAKKGSIVVRKSRYAKALGRKEFYVSKITEGQSGDDRRQGE